MTSRQRTLQILIALAIGVLLCWHFWDSIWTQSVDFAHHYALVSRLAEFGSLQHTPDPSLGEMQIYPELSHRFAAVLGRLWGSSIAGIQAVSLASTVVLWAAIGFALWSQPKRIARASTVALIVLLAVAELLLHLDLWGSEIVFNFFYAQFVAQAAALLVLGVVLAFAQCGVSRFVLYALLIAGMFSIEWMHLLPAIELLGFLGLLILVDQMSQPDRWNWRGFAVSALFCVAALVAVVANPVFRAMASISENDGVLHLFYVPTRSALLVLVLATLLASAMGLHYWFRLPDLRRQREQLVVKYFALLGLAIGVLCLMQMAALTIGRGSDYACKKYAFGLWSTLLVNLSLGIARAIVRRSDSRVIPGAVTAVFDYCAIGFIVFVAAVTVFPRHGGTSLSGLMSMEQRLEAVKSAFPAVPDGKSTYAIELPGEPPLIDYLFSVGLFKSARSANTVDIIRNQDLSLPGQIGLIVTATDKSRYNIPACRLPGGDATLSVIDGACYAKTIPDHRFCNTEMRLTDARFLQGFSSPEEQGIWTDGPEASFHCEMPKDLRTAPAFISVSGFAFLPSTHTQRVLISVNGGARVPFTFSATAREQTMRLPFPAGARSLSVQFYTPDAISPLKVGMSSDPRNLGLYVKTIKLLQADGSPIDVLNR